MLRMVGTGRRGRLRLAR